MKLRALSSLSALFVLIAVLSSSGQPLEASSAPAASVSAANDADVLPDAPVQQTSQQAAAAPGTSSTSTASAQNGKQTKRILYIVPNFRAVSSDEKLPPQPVTEKFKTATLDSVDYSSFIFVAGQAGVNQARNATPEFRQGAAGFGRYFWHTYADTLDENLWVEFLLPVAFRQDSRFYTLNEGGLAKKLAYSASRVLITRTDGGRETVNLSEILGAGSAAGISNLYYPNEERTFTKVYQRWLTSISIDGVTFVVKEFWPVINDKFFHQTD